MVLSAAFDPVAADGLAAGVAAGGAEGGAPFEGAFYAEAVRLLSLGDDITVPNPPDTTHEEWTNAVRILVTTDQLDALFIANSMEGGSRLANKEKKIEFLLNQIAT